MRAAHLLNRILLLIALVMASMPSGATETVCIFGKAEKVVPVAKCGMPCCAQAPAKVAAPSKKSCCAPKSEVTEAKVARVVCSLADKSCRCETRLIVGSPPVTAALDIKAFHSSEQPAVLDASAFEVPALSLVIVEPGIVGVDSGPPHERPRSPQQARAPPVSF